MSEHKWPCGCEKRHGETSHQHTFHDHANEQPRCQVLHDHWEGPMICGNPLPCPRHR